MKAVAAAVVSSGCCLYHGREREMKRVQRLPGEEGRGYLKRRQELPEERAAATWEEGRGYLGENIDYLGRRQKLPGGRAAATWR